MTTIHRWAEQRCSGSPEGAPCKVDRKDAGSTIGRPGTLKTQAMSTTPCVRRVPRRSAVRAMAGHSLTAVELETGLGAVCEANDRTRGSLRAAQPGAHSGMGSAGHRS